MDGLSLAGSGDQVYSIPVNDLMNESFFTVFLHGTTHIQREVVLQKSTYYTFPIQC